MEIEYELGKNGRIKDMDINSDSPKNIEEHLEETGKRINGKNS